MGDAFDEHDVGALGGLPYAVAIGNGIVGNDNDAIGRFNPIGDRKGPQAL